jgi:hypothetical protein
MPIDAGQELGKGLGLQTNSVFNPKRPWQVAVWYEGMPSQPLVALKVPTDDVEKFKAGLNPDSFLGSQGQEWTQLEGGYGLVTLMASDALSEPQQLALAEWKQKGVEKPRHMIQLGTRLSEPLRQQALLMLSFGKMAMSQSFATNNAFAAAGANPQVLGDIIGLYFEVIATVVKGLDRFDLGLDLNEDAVLFEEVLTARPATELAGWLTKSKRSIPADQTARIDPGALMSFAGQLDMDSSDTNILNRFLSLGLQLQSTSPEDPSIAELNALVKALLPVTFVGSVYSGKAMSYSGTYAFPEFGAEKAYTEIKKFLAHGMQSMAGKDKMYESVSILEKHRTLNGVAVDRVVLVINTNSPLLGMPGQKEQLLAVWPTGKMEFDYALKDDRVIFGSPDQMTSMLDPESRPQAKALSGSLDEGTVLAGTMNFIGVMGFSVNANPMLPSEIKAQLSGLNPKGTEVEYRVSLNNAMRINARLPMQLFKELSKIGAQPPKDP